jgi:hypothetical protein
MTDKFKVSEASEGRRRIQPTCSWWVEILCGLGIGVALGGVMVAVIFLDRLRLIPSWMLGWISNDRETQKRQILLAFYLLSAVWIAIQLVKLGLFGESVKIGYSSTLLKLGIVRKEWDSEFHDRTCAVKSPRISAFLTGFFVLEAFFGWRELGKPFVERNLYDLLFRVVLSAIVLFPILFRISKCFAERFIVVIIMTRVLTGYVFEYAPGIVESSAGLVRLCYLVLYIFGLLASLGLLVSSLSAPKSTE